MSRRKSAPAAKKATKSAPSRPAGRQVMVPKPKSDVYVALLGVSLAALILSCALLAWVLKTYDFKTKVSNVPSATLTSLA